MIFNSNLLYHLRKSNHHTNDNLMYFAFRRNSNRKNKSNLNDTTSLQIDLSANSDQNVRASFI